MLFSCFRIAELAYKDRSPIALVEHGIENQQAFVGGVELEQMVDAGQGVGEQAIVAVANEAIGMEWVDQSFELVDDVSSPRSFSHRGCSLRGSSTAKGTTSVDDLPSYRSLAFPAACSLLH